jgi:hypothetical protein
LEWLGQGMALDGQAAQATQATQAAQATQARDGREEAATAGGPALVEFAP